MKKAFFKYLLFLLGFVLNGYTTLYANARQQDNCLPCFEHTTVNRSSSSQNLNISGLVSEDLFDLKVIEIEIEESEKAISKKTEHNHPFLEYFSTEAYHFNVNNKSLITNGLFYYTLFSKRYILFQVFRI